MFRNFFSCLYTKFAIKTEYLKFLKIVSNNNGQFCPKQKTDPETDHNYKLLSRKAILSALADMVHPAL